MKKPLTVPGTPYSGSMAIRAISPFLLIKLQPDPLRTMGDFWEKYGSPMAYPYFYDAKYKKDFTEEVIYKTGHRAFRDERGNEAWGTDSVSVPGVFGDVVVHLREYIDLLAQEATLYVKLELNGRIIIIYKTYLSKYGINYRETPLSIEKTFYHWEHTEKEIRKRIDAGIFDFDELIYSLIEPAKKMAAKVTEKEATKQINSIKKQMEDARCPMCGSTLSVEMQEEDYSCNSTQPPNYDLDCPSCGFTISTFLVYPLNELHIERNLEQVNKVRRRLTKINEECNPNEQAPF